MKNSKPSVYIFFLITFCYFEQSLTVYESDNELLNDKIQQRVLLLTIDGFRQDYIKTYNLKNFEKIQTESASANLVRPEFPAQTIPSFWSMATGSRVENHGIVANNFYDPVLKRKFQDCDYSYSRLKLWSNSDPIWVDTVKNNLKTGLLFWPESNQHVYDPYLYKTMNHPTMSLIEKIDITIDLISNGNFVFCVIKHNQPAMVSYEYGIGSEEFNRTLNSLDESLGHLMDKLEKHGLAKAKDFNLLILSNHGIVNIDQHVVLDTYFHKDDAVVWSDSNSLFHLKPLIKFEDLMKKVNRIPGVTVYTKNSIPESSHYKNSPRIGDILLHARDGVSLLFMRNKVHRNGTKRYIQLIEDSAKASDGYNRFSKKMAGILIAYGPVFKENYQSNNSMSNIDVKPLLCWIFKIECSNIDGSFKNVREYLFMEEEKELSPYSNYVSRNYLFILYIAFMYFLSVFSVILLSIGNMYKIKWQLYPPPNITPSAPQPSVNQPNVNKPSESQSSVKEPLLNESVEKEVRKSQPSTNSLDRKKLNQTKHVTIAI